METTTERGFKAVNFMRQVRNDLSDLYQADKQRYHDELRQAMAAFLATRTKATGSLPQAGPDPAN